MQQQRALQAKQAAVVQRKTQVTDPDEMCCVLPELRGLCVNHMALEAYENRVHIQHGEGRQWHDALSPLASPPEVHTKTQTRLARDACRKRWLRGVV